jgi:hypothetical protein
MTLKIYGIVKIKIKGTFVPLNFFKTKGDIL